jgi:hypothetical protein
LSELFDVISRSLGAALAICNLALGNDGFGREIGSSNTLGLLDDRKYQFERLLHLSDPEERPAPAQA